MTDSATSTVLVTRAINQLRAAAALLRQNGFPGDATNAEEIAREVEIELADDGRRGPEEPEIIQIDAVEGRGVVTADLAASNYNPASNNYRLVDDPRCLYGWGPPKHGCRHMFGHSCFRAFGHRGRCWDSVEHRADAMPCESVQRPKSWDAEGRAEANR